LPEKNNIAAIVLAAGASSRFGTNKLLHPLTLGGVTKPLIAHSLMPWLEVFEQVTIVVGKDSNQFCNDVDTALGKLSASAINWIACEDSASGMSASLACGVRANINAAGWLIGLSDMPKLPSAAISGVFNAILEGASLAAPFCNDERGHPVGFSSYYKEDLLVLQGDTGAKQIIKRDKASLIKVNVEDNGIFVDVDTLTDLQNI